MVKCPKCAICGSTNGVKFLKFGNYQPLPHGWDGQSKGLEWICEKHYARAHTLSQFNSNHVINYIREQEIEENKGKNKHMQYA